MESQNARFGMKYHLMRTMDVKMMIVDVTRRKTDANDIYLSYWVAFLCIIDKVDLADPVLCNAILRSFEFQTKIRLITFSWRITKVLWYLTFLFLVTTPSLAINTQISSSDVWIFIHSQINNNKFPSWLQILGSVNNWCLFYWSAKWYLKNM